MDNRNYIKIKKLSELKGHSMCYFIDTKFHPKTVSTILLDMVVDKYKNMVAQQLKKWMNEGKLYKL